MDNWDSLVTLVNLTSVHETSCLYNQTNSNQYWTNGTVFSCQCHACGLTSNLHVLDVKWSQLMSKWKIVTSRLWNRFIYHLHFTCKRTKTIQNKVSGCLIFTLLTSQNVKHCNNWSSFLVIVIINEKVETELHSQSAILTRIMTSPSLRCSACWSTAVN